MPSRLVYVEWIDAAGSDETWLQEVDLKPAKIKRGGWLVRESNQAIVIAQSSDDNDPPKHDNVLAIPRAAIHHRRLLR